MKKIVVFITMLFSAAILAQSPGWSNLKETNITVGNNNYDIFTNGAGNHIIIQEANALKYYKMDVNGNTIINLNPPLESSAVTSPSISGDATRLYVVYRKGTENKIRAKYSSDSGVNWSYISDLNLTTTPSSVECVFSKNNLYVTYQIGTFVYFSYYRTNIIPPSWTAPQQVSGNIYSATNPRITINNYGSVDTVYFTFDEFDARQIKWRRYNVDSGMGPLFSFYQSSQYYLKNLCVSVDNSYIYYFYYDIVGLRNQWRVNRIWNNAFYVAGATTGTTVQQKIFSTTTANNTPCTAAWNESSTTDGIYGMRMNGSDVLLNELIYNNPSQTMVDVVNLSAAGNDIHVVWKDNLSNNKLRYKYYDDYPVPPQNLTVTKSLNNHPYLSWLNPNPDASIYKIYRLNACSGGWEFIGQTTNLSYEDQTQSYCTAVPPAQCTDLCVFSYKIKTVDVGLKESDYSYPVQVILIGGPPSKTVVDDPDVTTAFEYFLDQNYPNPFNPITKISYSIKEEGLVTLKVYDVLGKEVATLINENKTAGNYETEFNASTLPSGMYIYKLQAGSYSAVKKMLLTK